MLPSTLSTWENWISENLCDMWVCTKNPRLEANVVFSIPYCLLSYFLSAYGTVLGAIETLPRPFQFRTSAADTPAGKGRHIQPNWHWSAHAAVVYTLYRSNHLSFPLSLPASLLCSTCRWLWLLLLCSDAKGCLCCRGGRFPTAHSLMQARMPLPPGPPPPDTLPSDVPGRPGSRHPFTCHAGRVTPTPGKTSRCTRSKTQRPGRGDGRGVGPLRTQGRCQVEKRNDRL